MHAQATIPGFLGLQRTSPLCLFLYFLFGICVVATPASAAITLLPQDGRSLDLTREIALLEDPVGQLGIAEVSAQERVRQFRPGAADTNNIGFTASTWWVRLHLRNADNSARTVYLRQNYPLIDHLDLFSRESPGHWLRKRAGDRHEFKAREIRHHDPIFALTLPANGDATYYLRYQSQGPVDISLDLYGAAEFAGQLSVEQLAYGIYFGCVMMLMLWSLLVFLATRDRAFITYFSYVALFGLYMAANNGLAFQFFWPGSPDWGNAAIVVLLAGSIVASAQFAKEILHGADFSPKLTRFASVLQLLALLIIALSPFSPYAMLIQPLAMLTLVLTVFMIVYGISCLLSGSRSAAVFLLAWGTYMLCSIAYLLKNFGLLPHTVWTQNSWQLGALLEMIFLSLTLSGRVKELQAQTRIDALTQLGNRRLFEMQVPSLIRAARAKHSPLAMLVFDIDHFKQFNDRFGHAEGDKAIRAVAKVLRQNVRKPEIACRFGGEEFVLVLPNASTDSAILLAERIRKAVLENTRQTHPVHLSVGVANAQDLPDAGIDALFNAADFALYCAKTQGRDRVVDYRQCESRRAGDGMMPA